MAKKITELFKEAIAKADTPEGRRAPEPCPRIAGTISDQQNDANQQAPHMSFAANLEAVAA